MTASIGRLSTALSYELPRTVRDLAEGWLKTFSAFAVVSALVVSTEAQLLSSFQSAYQNNPTSANQALLILTYVALMLAFGATLVSLILTQEFAVLGLRSARDTKSKLDIYDGDSASLIVRYNAGRTLWKTLTVHLFVALILAFLCLVAQVVLYALPGVPVWAKCVVVVAAAYVTLPLLALMPHNMFTFRGARPGDNESLPGSKSEPAGSSQAQTVRETVEVSPMTDNRAEENR